MSKTIQLWPGGGSVTFSGDYPHYKVQDKDGLIREGSASEQRAIQRNELAAMYAERDVLCCDSSLVDDLLKAEFCGFSIDDIENTYVDPSDWTMEQCKEYLDYNGGEPRVLNLQNPWEMDRETLTDELNIDDPDDERGSLPDDNLRELVIGGMNDGSISGLDDWRDAVREYSQDNPQEPYEWWRVSRWLCSELRKLGEVVIDNDYGEWWGRSCTGQSMLMDGTLQNVADGFLN